MVGRRLIPVLLGALALHGCYLSHRPLEPDEVDAGVCEAPPREPVIVRIELLSVSPADCGEAGAVYSQEMNLDGGPLTPDCPDSFTTLTPDGCGLQVEATCLGVEYERRVSGTLRGADGAGTMEVRLRAGFLFEWCDRVERWTVVR